MAAKPKLLWSRLALADLRAIKAYVNRDQPEAAKRLAALIRAQVLRLRDHPRAGRLVPELEGSGFREVIVAPYRIVFEVRKGEVFILRIWHGRRDLSSVH